MGWDGQEETDRFCMDWVESKGHHGCLRHTLLYIHLLFQREDDFQKEVSDHGVEYQSHQMEVLRPSMEECPL